MTEDANKIRADLSRCDAHGYSNRVAQKYGGCGCVHCQSEPRYVVALSAQGWRIRDNEEGTIGTERYATERHAHEQAELLEE